MKPKTLSREQLASYICQFRGFPLVGPERDAEYQFLLTLETDRLWKEYLYYQWLRDLKPVAQGVAK